jgi:flavocytochrome c
VVIIGSGFAGLAAAIEAKNAGSSVAILEKMRVPGGNSIINGGIVAAAGSPLQGSEGIKDSPDLLYKDMMKAGLNLNHPDLARTVAEKSNESVQWTIEYLDVKYKERVMQLGGHCVPRSYTTYNQSGSAIVRQQLAKIKELGMKVRTRAYLAKLLTDGDGTVRGLKISEGYVFPKANSGAEKLFKARKAIVLATGGFSNDIIFRTIQDPRLTEETDSTNQPGATAEGLVEALRIGATPVQLSWIQLGPWACPDEKGLGIAPIFAVYSAFPYGVMVDPSTGKRFVNELADRKVRADAIIKTGNISIGIADSEAAKHSAHLMDKMLKRGSVKKFDTLEKLAAEYKINLKGLKETIGKYNYYVKNGKDEKFGKPIRKDAKPLIKPPFYAMRLWPKVHHTMGGLQINTKAQAISLSHKPISRLYVAGEVSGGVHGAVRLGSCAVVDCLVFGRIAGKNAAAEKSWS